MHIKIFYNEGLLKIHLIIIFCILSYCHCPLSTNSKMYSFEVHLFDSLLGYCLIVAGICRNEDLNRTSFSTKMEIRKVIYFVIQLY